MARTLFDRDTAPGAEPEDLIRLDMPALIVPGRDTRTPSPRHAISRNASARAEYWDVPVADQTEAKTPARLLEFLNAASAASR